MDFTFICINENVSEVQVTFLWDLNISKMIPKLQISVEILFVWIMVFL